MECKNKTVMHNEDCNMDDKTRVKEEYSNPDEKSTESQIHHHPYNEMDIEEYVSSVVDTEIEIKQETWDPNDIKCDLAESSTSLGTGTIKGENEVNIKQEPRWGDGTSTESHNEEKKIELESNKGTESLTASESSRLSDVAVYLDGSSQSFQDTGTKVHKGTSKPAKGALPRGREHFEPVETINDGSNCKVCGDNISISSMYHLQPKSHTCNNCFMHNSQPKADSLLTSGRKKGHKLLHSGTKSYKCEHCGKCFTKQWNLNQHKLLHSDTKPHKCEHCDKSFTQKAALNHHILVHSGIKPFKCEHCDKCFTQKSALNQHKLLHSDTKPHKCEHCNKSFIRQWDLKEHKLLHSDTKPYKCEHCNKCYTTKSHLNQHKLLHLGTKPHKCEHCSKCFTSISYLNRHILLHSGTKPYKCEHCDKSFTKQWNLDQHKLLHLGTKAYKCKYCEKCFTHKSNMTKHKLIHSGTKL